MSTGLALDHDLIQTTLAGQSERAAEHFGDTVAQVSRVDGQWGLCAPSLRCNAALRLAALLAALGVRRSDRVALLARTCPEWTIAI